MKILTLILVIFPFIACGQGDEEYEQFVLQSSLPGEFRGQLSNAGFFEHYKLNSRLNPFYLRGDFNGDGSTDYAVSVIDKKTNKYGIAVLFEPNKHVLIGAGVSLSNREMDDFSWMDAWSVYDAKNVELGVGETEQISLNSEAILAIKTESASGVIYWTGEEFLWYQQGD